MKRTVYFALGLWLLVAGLCLYSYHVNSEPYLHYKCSFPTGVQTGSIVTFTVGVETPPVLSYVTFDVSLSGQYKAESAYRIELTGGSLSTTFSYNENWLKLGVNYTLDSTFSTFVEFKLVFSLFRNMGVQTGGL